MVRMVQAGKMQRTRFRGIQHETLVTHNKGHGRLEKRRHILITDPAEIEYFNRDGRWWNLGAIGIVERTRTIGDRATTEIHLFITSLKTNVQRFAHAVRQHWGIENSLHWVLDVTFHDFPCLLTPPIAASYTPGVPLLSHDPLSTAAGYRLTPLLSAEGAVLYAPLVASAEGAAQFQPGAQRRRRVSPGRRRRRARAGV